MQVLFVAGQTTGAVSAAFAKSGGLDMVVQALDRTGVVQWSSDGARERLLEKSLREAKNHGVLCTTVRIRADAVRTRPGSVGSLPSYSREPCAMDEHF